MRIPNSLLKCLYLNNNNIKHGIKSPQKNKHHITAIKFLMIKMMEKYVRGYASHVEYFVQKSN